MVKVFWTAERNNHSAVDGVTRGWSGCAESAFSCPPRVICVKAPDRIMSQKPNFSEAFPETAIREGLDELTLRAGELGMQRVFINTEHLEFER